MRGQYPIDKIAPGEIKSPKVDNIPGGAIISYELPKDADLLYVKAVYVRNGKTVEQKASAYNDSLKVEGFGKSQEIPVQLIAYDRSGNASKPVTVNAHPLASPIYSILKSLLVQDDFGGIRLDWKNPSSANIALTIITSDQNKADKYTELKTFYSNLKDGFGNLRGQPSTETVYGIYIRDRWGNITDTLIGTYHPIFEIELDKSKFVRWNPPGIPYNAYTTSNWYIENAWDNSLNKGFATWNLDFTFDMGQVAKLSRFKIYQRTPPLLYTLGHPKIFQLWGSLTPNVNGDTSTWKYIGTFVSKKPSGLPEGQVSDEDIKYAATDGEPFTVPLSAPPARYIWFHCIQTWGNADRIQFMEMTFFGDNKY